MNSIPKAQNRGRGYSMVWKVAFAGMLSFILVGCGLFDERRACQSERDCLAGERCEQSFCAEPRSCHNERDCLADESCIASICQDNAKNDQPKTSPKEPTKPKASPPPRNTPVPPPPTRDTPADTPSKPSALGQNEFAYIIEKNERHQVHVHNVDTDQSRFLFQLEGGPERPSGIKGSISLSPDRRWITFLAKYPRTEYQKTLSEDELISSVWLASIDGKTFRRLSSAVIVPPELPGHLRTHRFSKPKWSHDGKHIWLTYVTTRSISFGELSFHVMRARVDLETGQVEFIDDKVSCTSAGAMDFAIHRKRPLYAMATSSCWLEKFQLFYTQAPGGAVPISHPKVFHQGTMSFIGDHLLYQGYSGEYQEEPQHLGLYMTNFQTKETKQLYTLEGGMWINEITTSPDQKKAILKATFKDGQVGIDQFDFSTNPTQIKTVSIPSNAQSLTW